MGDRWTREREEEGEKEEGGKIKIATEVRVLLTATAADIPAWHTPTD